MERRLRWGILGTASIARRRFMPAMLMSKNAEAIAIGSRTLERAQECAGEFDIPVPYGSYQEVLDDPRVESVYIPLPNHMHAEWTIRAADAGKHVLCEKPMAVDAEEALQMADHCRERGVTLMEGFMYRLNPRTQQIKRMVADGAVGEPRTVFAQFAFNIDSPENTRLIPGKGAGSLMDVGCYCINWCRYILGAEPVSVMARQKIDEHSGGDLSTSAILEFTGGRTALISCSFETSYRNSVQVTGSAGVIRAERFFTPPEQGMIGFTLDTGHGDLQHFEFDAVDQFLLEIEHFSGCILENTPVLLDPYAESVPNAQVIDAVRESARTGCQWKAESSEEMG